MSDGGHSPQIAQNRTPPAGGGHSPQISPLLCLPLCVISHCCQDGAGRGHRNLDTLFFWVEQHSSGGSFRPPSRSPSSIERSVQRRPFRVLHSAIRLPLSIEPCADCSLFRLPMVAPSCVARPRRKECRDSYVRVPLRLGNSGKSRTRADREEEQSEDCALHHDGLANLLHPPSTR